MSFNLKGEDVKEFTMLVLANTLLLSFTLVLSLDVPAEVKEAEEDLVDFGGSVLRKSGLVIDYMVGAAATLGKQGAANTVIKRIFPI